ncbi:hypothetical protein QQF64_020376 [Cirrhinus molitorella]|uniref:TTI1 C-terminal TPR domain-containing protein n=1 Tax=Cirrhinus molitorella TaxID=172907 RepID=A0ABR3LBM2_9TELE
MSCFPWCTGVGLLSSTVSPMMTLSLYREHSRKQEEISARSGPVYTTPLAYKLQLAVLQGLGPLVCETGPK